MDILDTAKFLVEHGATGVLAVAVCAESYVIHRLWRERDEREKEHAKLLNEVQEARIDDIQAYTVRAETLHDKVYKTASDLEKLGEIMRERRSR